MRLETLRRRQDDIVDRITILEKKVQCILDVNTGSPEERSRVANRFSERRRGNRLVPDPHGTVARLEKELEERGVQDVAFVRAPPEYYEKELEFRRNVLDAPSIHHLCKSIIMENTRMDEEPGIVKYWLVIVQYSSRLDSEILRSCVHSYHKGRISRGKINMRLVSEETSYELSGFQKNAVTPVGMKTQLPIVLAQEIVDLDPDEFWIGGGEVDLKLGMTVSDFVKAYEPIIVSLGSRE